MGFRATHIVVTSKMFLNNLEKPATTFLFVASSRSFARYWLRIYISTVLRQSSLSLSSSRNWYGPSSKVIVSDEVSHSLERSSHLVRGGPRSPAAGPLQPLGDGGSEAPAGAGAGARAGGGAGVRAGAGAVGGPVTGSGDS